MSLKTSTSLRYATPVGNYFVYNYATENYDNKMHNVCTQEFTEQHIYNVADLADCD